MLKATLALKPSETLEDTGGVKSYPAAGCFWVSASPHLRLPVRLVSLIPRGKVVASRPCRLGGTGGHALEWFHVYVKMWLFALFLTTYFGIFAWGYKIVFVKHFAEWLRPNLCCFVGNLLFADSDGLLGNLSRWPLYALFTCRTMGIAPPPSRCLHTATPRACLTSRLAPRRIVQGCRIGQVRESSASGLANYFLMWRRFFWRACFLADQIPLKGSWGAKGAKRECAVAGHTVARGGAHVTPCLPWCIDSGTPRLQCCYFIFLLLLLSASTVPPRKAAAELYRHW